MRKQTILLVIFLILSCILCDNLTQNIIHSRKLSEAEFHLNQLRQKYALDFTCTACVVLLTAVINGTKREKEALKRTFASICNYLPPQFNTTCRVVIDVFSEYFIERILRGETASHICNSADFFRCNGCTLYAKLPTPDSIGIQASEDLQFKAMLAVAFMQKYLYDSNPENAKRVLPMLDSDSDKFSPTDKLIRGATWRGRDCGDYEPHVKPGVYDTDPDKDGNCNGIFGRDEQGRSFEDLYCKDSGEKSILIFGDSGSSAFHIPPEYLHLKKLETLIDVLQNEFDWPHLSWGSGYADEINGTSIYLMMRNRNLCNHRDYQNVGFNGGRMTHFASSQLPGVSLAPHHKPFIAFVSYIGNDVCKRTLADMTKPEDYERQLLVGLQNLNALAPKGSKVLITGLVDGRILWDEMANRMHPIGIPYKNLYHFLSCTSANPCATWLTNNQTLRDAASQRAFELSQTAKRVVMENKNAFPNLELAYMDFPLKEAIETAKRMGRSPADLIEAFDGFHPSHFGHRIFAQLIWKFMETNVPHWIGKVNPYNEQIKKRFGNQGGH